MSFPEDSLMTLYSVFCVLNISMEKKRTYWTQFVVNQLSIQCRTQSMGGLFGFGFVLSNWTRSKRTMMYALLDNEPYWLHIPLVVFVWYFFGQYDTNPITSHGVWCCDGVDRRRRRRRLQCDQHVWKGVHIVCQRAHCTLWFCWHAVFTEVFVQTQFSGQSLQEDVEACGCLCSRPDRDEEAVTTCSNDCYL